MRAESPPGTSAFEVSVNDLHVHFPVKRPFIQNIFSREKPVVHAVDGVSFSIKRGEIFGLVGESGSGKTTLGKAIVRLVEPTAGRIVLNGKEITHLSEPKLRPLRRQMQIIFQDPHASMNPAMTIGQAITHPLKIHGITKTKNRDEVKSIVLQVMREVGLSPEDQLYSKYPSDLSGGQKQRAAIARALVLRPMMIVADEPVAMLDMSIRAKVLQLLLDLRSKYDLAFVFITHDLATAKFLCDRIAIMYLGRIVEIGPSKSIFTDPKHPYTKALLQAIPIPDPRRRTAKILPKGEVPDAVNPPAGCRFHPRCLAVLPTCGWEGRDFIDYLEGRRLVPGHAEQDEQILGPLEKWSARGLRAEWKIEGQDTAAIIVYLKDILRDANLQMTRAVQTVSVKDDHVVVEFQKPDVLLQKDVDGRTVECLLYQ
jgi:oligopeptide/dipeptide ABC transporter ATP-binding protein